MAHENVTDEEVAELIRRTSELLELFWTELPTGPGDGVYDPLIPLELVLPPWYRLHPGNGCTPVTVNPSGTSTLILVVGMSFSVGTETANF